MVNLNNLFDLMKVRGTAKQLSEATGISSGNISDWKNGRSMPSAIKLDAIANYYGVSVDYLLGRSTPALSHEHSVLMTKFDKLSDEDKEIIA